MQQAQQQQLQPQMQPSIQQQQQQQQQEQQVPGPRTHTCMSCQVPIAVHGRLVPCKHAFCLECATEMPKCIICCNNIQVVERVQQPMYVSPLTQRTYFTEEELEQDARTALRRIMGVPAAAQAYQHYQQSRQGRPTAAAGGQQQQR